MSISPIPDVPPGSHNSVSREPSKDTLADSNRTGDDSHNSIRPKPSSVKGAFKSVVLGRDENSSAGQSSQSPSLSNGARSPSAPVPTLGRPPSQTLQQPSEPSGSHSPGGSLRGTSSKGDSKFFTKISCLHVLTSLRISTAPNWQLPAPYVHQVILTTYNSSPNSFPCQ